MTTNLEDRLRRELTRAPAGGPDMAILAEIKQRSVDEVSDARVGVSQTSPNPNNSNRGTYLLTMAAAIVAVVGAIFAIGQSDGPTTGVDAASDVVDLRLAAPSPLWLLVVLAVGVMLMVPARRLRAGRLMVLAMAIGTVGVAVAVASMLPAWQTGERLSTVLPELEGYEAVDTRLNPWPTLGGFDEITVTYRPTNGQTITLADDSPEAVTGELRRLADQFNWNNGLPNLGLPCRQFNGGAGDATTAVDPRTGDFFCLADIESGQESEQLIVIGTDDSVGALWARRLASTPLVGLALVLAVLAILDQRRPGPTRSLGTQFAYGVTVAMAGFALFFVGIFAVNAIRVSQIDGIQTCRNAPETVLTADGDGNVDSNPDDGFDTCREYVNDLVDSQDLTGTASSLYGPVVVLADIAATILLGFGALISLILARAGQLGTWRRRLLIAAVVLTVLSVGVQVYHYNTIAVTTDAYD